jgi:hypothetical protein
MLGRQSDEPFRQFDHVTSFLKGWARASAIPTSCAKACWRNFANNACNNNPNRSRHFPPCKPANGSRNDAQPGMPPGGLQSNFDQRVGAAARFLDREGHVVDRRAARGAALIAAMVGMAVNDGADLEAVDGFAQ